MPRIGALKNIELFVNLGCLPYINLKSKDLSTDNMTKKRRQAETRRLQKGIEKEGNYSTHSA